MQYINPQTGVMEFIDKYAGRALSEEGLREAISTFFSSSPCSASVVLNRVQEIKELPSGFRTITSYSTHQLADTYGRKMNEPRVKNKLYNAEGRMDQQMRKERITKEPYSQKDWKSVIKFRTGEISQQHSGITIVNEGKDVNNQKNYFVKQIYTKHKQSYQIIVPIVDVKQTTGDGSDKKLLKNKMDANGPKIVKLAIPPNLPAAHPDVKEELERERNMKISPEESKISKTEQLPNKSETNEKEKKKGPAEETEFIPIGKDVKP
uniref:DUF1738 domain-containing protein n=1 Tax=Heterorhabditis bacteriophora TaxID=37862 RepID=A0A1I7XBH1_HETBA